ncbi:MAG: hypothetical protein K0S56_573 [Microvirga sp.]|jgi:hypothetical protein|nr:hypothetical protein [Microvirga sp.]
MTKNNLETMTNAHTNLTVFSAVADILENGHLYGSDDMGRRTAEKIVSLCRKEQTKLYLKYEAARAALVQKKDQGQ